MKEPNKVKIYDYFVPDRENMPEGFAAVDWTEVEFGTEVNLTAKRDLLELMYAALHGHSETIREMMKDGEL